MDVKDVQEGKRPGYIFIPGLANFIFHHYKKRAMQHNALPVFHLMMIHLKPSWKLILIPDKTNIFWSICPLPGQ